MVNIIIAILAKIKAFNFCMKKIISEKPQGGAESAPPVEIGLKVGT